MTVKELMAGLRNFPTDAHVCIALPEALPRGRVQVYSVWGDRWGQINLITGENCGEMDPDLEAENNIEEAEGEVKP